MVLNVYIVNTISAGESKVYKIIKPQIITKYLHVDQKQYRILPFWKKQKNVFLIQQQIHN